ncbi:hypothetical protein [Marispirochaeta sp.]|uniref:hypothetical protein n=1 Tax=Marispirochaeta sp. TaxID=2038653 RepID=UPI0029C6AD7C|nr:hypothetical protein [Marispirochaeta sp.]
MEELRKILMSDGEGQAGNTPHNEKILRFQEKVYRCRYRPVEDGWLFTLLDLTEEQLLRTKLHNLLSLINSSDDLVPVLACVEDAMAEIRYAVGQLASEGEKP